MFTLAQQRKQCGDGAGAEAAQSMLRLLRVNKAIEAVEARNVMGDLLAWRQSRSTGALRLPSNDLRKERPSWEGVRQRASISS